MAVDYFDAKNSEHKVNSFMALTESNVAKLKNGLVDATSDCHQNNQHNCSYDSKASTVESNEAVEVTVK